MQGEFLKNIFIFQQFGIGKTLKDMKLTTNCKHNFKQHAAKKKNWSVEHRIFEYQSVK